MISTVEDLLRFADALLTEKLVTGATLKKMLTPYELKNGDVTTYGLGFQVGHEAKGRRGDIAGGASPVCIPNREVRPRGAMGVAGRE